MTDERTRNLLGWLGKIVTVRLANDAQGSTQTLRRGYLPSTASGKGGDMPVYLMGCAPVGSAYTGRVVSAMRRQDRGEDKLIVAPVGREL